MNICTWTPRCRSLGESRSFRAPTFDTPDPGRHLLRRSVRGYVPGTRIASGAPEWRRGAHRSRGVPRRAWTSARRPAGIPVCRCRATNGSARDTADLTGAGDVGACSARGTAGASDDARRGAIRSGATGLRGSRPGRTARTGLSPPGHRRRALSGPRRPQGRCAGAARQGCRTKRGRRCRMDNADPLGARSARQTTGLRRRFPGRGPLPPAPRSSGRRVPARAPRGPRPRCRGCRPRRSGPPCPWPGAGGRSRRSAPPR